MKTTRRRKESEANKTTKIHRSPVNHKWCFLAQQPCKRDLEGRHWERVKTLQSGDKQLNVCTLRLPQVCPRKYCCYGVWCGTWEVVSKMAEGEFCIPVWGIKKKYTKERQSQDLKSASSPMGEDMSVRTKINENCDNWNGTMRKSLRFFDKSMRRTHWTT